MIFSIPENQHLLGQNMCTIDYQPIKNYYYRAAMKARTGVCLNREHQSYLAQELSQQMWMQ